MQIDLLTKTTPSFYFGFNTGDISGYTIPYQIENEDKLILILDMQLQTE
jgi:hypothetical protein